MDVAEAPHLHLFDGFLWLAPTGNPLTESGGFKAAKTLWTYPSDVTSITTAFTNLSQFCFPDLERARIESPTSASSKAEFFTFTLTEGDGHRVYGVCMRALFRGEAGRFDAKRRPRHCLCVITRYPFFSLLRTVLMQVHALALLDEEHQPSLPPSSAVRFLEQVYKKVPPPLHALSQNESAVSVPSPLRRSSLPAMSKDFNIHMPKHGGHGASVPILPLLEALGVEKFMHLLSAALCERRIIFVADDVEKLTSAVLAAATMLQPFEWQHIFIPLLPSNMFDYVTAPMPYMIGIRRYLLPKLERVPLEDVVLVDVDAGTLKVHATTKGLIKDFVGDSGSLQKQATENFDELIKTGTEWLNLIMGRGDDASDDSGPRDLMFVIISDLRTILASKPTKASLRNVASGIADTLTGSAKGLEESKVMWTIKSEKLLRDALLLFFVYLFADLDETVVTGDNAVDPTQSSTKNSSAKSSTSISASLTFGPGDSRAAFDLQSFLARRAQQGDSKHLQTFLAEFRHSQMFERFCDDKMKKLSSLKGGPGSLFEVKAPVTPQVVMRRRRASSSSSSSSSGGGAGEDNVYELVCRELRRTQRTTTISNAKRAIAAKSSTKNVVDLHVTTLQYTDGSTAKGLAEGNSEVARMHQQQTMERICLDANSSDQCNKIMRTIALRLESCRAAGSKGHSGSVGLRGLVLLRVLLISGPHCVLSHGLDMVPVLRQLINPSGGQGQGHGRNNGHAQGHAHPPPKTALGEIREAMRDARVGTTHVVEVSAAALSVLQLLLDHERLQHQRRYASLVKDGGLPFLTGGNQRMRAPPLQDFSKLHAMLIPRQSEEAARGSVPQLKLTEPVARRVTEDDDDEDSAKIRAMKRSRAAAAAKSPPASPAVKPAVSFFQSGSGSGSGNGQGKTGSKKRAPPSAAEVKRKMELIYSQNCPEKIPEIPALLAKYKGRESEILAGLEKKYPPLIVPVSASEVDSTRGSEESKDEAKVKLANKTSKSKPKAPTKAKSVAKSTSSITDVKAKMEFLYKLHCPNKIPEIPALLQKYEGRESEILAALEKKYLVDVALVKARMEEIYTQHCPNKLHEIPALLEKYEGRESEILAALEKKYCN